MARFYRMIVQVPGSFAREIFIGIFGTPISDVFANKRTVPDKADY